MNIKKTNRTGSNLGGQALEVKKGGGGGVGEEKSD